MFFWEGGDVFGVAVVFLGGFEKKSRMPRRKHQFVKDFTSKGEHFDEFGQNLGDPVWSIDL